MRPRDIQDVWRNQLDVASIRTTHFDYAKLYEPGTKVDSVVIDKPTKLKFPRFNRAQIQEWLVQVEQYFDSENTPEKYKVWLVSIHLDDVAKKWNRSLWHSVNDWETYRICLQEQFDISVAELHRLRETAGILAYHEQFELISARLSLPEDYLVQAYLNGLSLDTQRSVERFQPRTVKECRCFGCLHDILYSKNPTSYYAQSSKVSNATIEGTIVTVEDARSVAAAEEVLGVRNKPVDILEETNSTSPAVEVTGLGNKHVLLSDEAAEFPPTSMLETEDEVAWNENDISQETDHQNIEEFDVVDNVNNSEEVLAQSLKALLGNDAMMKMIERNGNVLFIQGSDVEHDSVMVQQTEISPADIPWVAMAEVFVYPPSHLKHKWRSKETSIPSMFQAGTDSTLDNMNEETRFSCFVASEAAGYAVMISYEMPVSVLPKVEEYRDMLQSPFFACSVAADVLVRPLKGFVMCSSCPEKGTMMSLESMLLEVAKLVSQLFTLNVMPREEEVGIVMQMAESDSEQRTISEANIQFLTSPRVHLIWGPGGVNFRDLCSLKLL